MISKQVLTLGLALSLMSPLTSFAKMGTESGGGGDAVIVNGQLVMRDFTEQTKKIKDNLEFINQVPKFREMIYKIAKVNPVFASYVIGELARVNLYESPTSLPILPYNITTLSGKGAEVQLATRLNDDIVFAPEYFTFKQKENVLLHEALHGLLADNSGPFHHIRVRNIVRYISENLNNLNADEFSEVLSENNWYLRESFQKNEMQEYAWGKNNNSDLRCYFAYQFEESNKFSGIPDAVMKFEKLDCVGKNEISWSRHSIDRNPNVQKYMTEHYPKMLALRGNEFITTPLYLSSFRTFELKKDGWLTSKTDTDMKKYICKSNNESADTLKNYIAKLENYAAAEKMMNDVLENDDLKPLEKSVIKEAMYFNYSDDEDSTAYQIRMEDLIKDKKDLLKTVLKQKTACDKQYPNL